MDPILPNALAESLAALPQVAERRAVQAATRARRPEPRSDAIAPVANADAVAAIGERGDDASRRDKHAEHPDDPRDHVDVVA